MPKEFDGCVKREGRVRTITGPSKDYGLEEDEYMHVCFIEGEMHRGKKKIKKSDTK